MLKLKHFAVVLMACTGIFAFQQVETEHFVVVFNPPEAIWADQVIKAAESVWDDLMAAYDITSQYQKVYIYILDPGDYSGGFTYPTKNHVTINTTQLEFNIRSTDDWIKNVVTHELAHVFSIKLANKDGFFDYFTAGRLSRFKNPDWSAYFVYSDLIAPPWWVEGTAQYESSKNKSDRWDTHRDMFLRMAALENDLLNYQEMSDFDNRNGFYPEMVYNQGFSMMLFLDSIYGEQTVRKIAKSKSWVHFNQSLIHATGKTGPELYDMWKKHLLQKYGSFRDSLAGSMREGKEFFDGGFWDFFGTRSPDGKFIALISNKGYDILYPKLYLLNTENGKLERVHRTRLMPVPRQKRPLNSLSFKAGKANVAPLAFSKGKIDGIFESENRADPQQQIRIPTVYSRIQWTHDSRKICYARWTENSEYRDVYVFDLDAKKEKQITWHARAKDPCPSPDGSCIAYIMNQSGIHNLVLVGADGRNTRQLTNFNDGTQLYDPCWTPDGKKIVIGIMNGKNRDIAVVNAGAVPFDRTRKQTDSVFFPDTLNYQPDLELTMLVNSKADERDPSVSPDGRFLYFSSDINGVFNIYRMDMESRIVEKVTNVPGGAFSPSIDASGTRLLYTGFHAANYSLYQLDISTVDTVEIPSEPVDFSKRNDGKLIFSAKPGNGQYAEEKYRPKFTLWHFGPFVSFEPAYITDTVGLSQFHTGFNVVAGDLSGAMNMSGVAYLAKHFSNSAGPSWGTQAQMELVSPAIYGENTSFQPQVVAFGSHTVIKDDDDFSEDTLPDNLLKAIPSTSSLLFSQDTLLAVYLSYPSGHFFYDRVFSTYGVFGSMAFSRYSEAGLYYQRNTDHLNGSVSGQVIQYHPRVLTISDKQYDNASDITDRVTGDGETELMDLLLEDYTFTSEAGDVVDIYRHFDLYKDHRIGGHYSFVNVRPSFSVPLRAGIFTVSGELINAVYNAGSLFNEYDEQEQEDGESLLYGLGPNGQVPLYTALEKQQDYAKIDLSALERFPLPGNKLFSSLPRPLAFRHFCTAVTAIGSINRKLPADYSPYPLHYRISDYMKGYPYSFDPVQPVVTRSYFEVGNVGPDSISTDSISFLDTVDGVSRDILWGNGMAYYGAEYTLELLRGATIPVLGVILKGLYLTSFFETAGVRNSGWGEFDAENLSPINTGSSDIKWRNSFLRDAGIRLELPLQFLDTWNAWLSFTWARRIDLDDEILEIRDDGTLIGLPRDRYSFDINIW